LITYDFCYQVWKSYRKDKLTKERAVSTINNACGYNTLQAVPAGV